VLVVRFDLPLVNPLRFQHTWVEPVLLGRILEASRNSAHTSLHPIATNRRPSPHDASDVEVVEDAADGFEVLVKQRSGLRRVGRRPCRERLDVLTVRLCVVGHLDVGVRESGAAVECN
jgi:hypothetical protein